jgi:hypothetical protein
LEWYLLACKDRPIPVLVFEIVSGSCARIIRSLQEYGDYTLRNRIDRYDSLDGLTLVFVKAFAPIIKQAFAFKKLLDFTVNLVSHSQGCRLHLVLTVCGLDDTVLRLLIGGFDDTNQNRSLII